jgi:glycosyltransferase involved in cell wall biosynthesis
MPQMELRSDRTSRRTRVAIVTEADPWSPSTRYRAMQHLPRLRERFARVELSLPRDTVVRRPGRVGQFRYFATHARRYRARTCELPSVVDEQDAVMVQRGLYVIGPGFIARSVERFPGRVVVDLDDAVFRPSPSLAAKGAVARWLYGPQQTVRLMQRADALVVSTQVLAEMLPRGLPLPTVLPTVPDPSAYHPVEHRAQTPVIVGWAGTVGGLDFLDVLETVFTRLQRDGVARLRVVCSTPWRGPSEFKRWRLADEHSLFDAFSIGIMPLPISDYTRAKGGFKLLQYMAAGIPVIATPLGINRSLVEESGGGLLVESPGEWEEALRLLAADHELRGRLGARGRAFVERYADLDQQADVLERLLRGDP